MILVKRTKFKILNYYQKWFYENIQLFDIFRIVSYKQMDKKINFPLFKRETFYTLLINLHSDIDKILEDFSKETRYEIRRAERDGIKVKKNISEIEFINFYNKFAENKNIYSTTMDKIKSFKENKLITGAYFKKELCVAHFYICDGNISRLLYSATTVNSKVSKSEIGRANRFLHYEDIKYFKELGYRFYDLGGIAKDTQDDKLQGINKFKEGFGGELVRQYNYYSPLYSIFLKLSRGD